MSFTPTPGRRTTHTTTPAVWTDPHAEQRRQDLALCGLDPLDAELDAQRERDELVDRLNEMAGPGDVRWSLTEGMAA